MLYFLMSIELLICCRAFLSIQKGKMSGVIEHSLLCSLQAAANFRIQQCARFLLETQPSSL